MSPVNVKRCCIRQALTQMSSSQMHLRKDIGMTADKCFISLFFITEGQREL